MLNIMQSWFPVCDSSGCLFEFDWYVAHLFNVTVIISNIYFLFSYLCAKQTKDKAARAETIPHNLSSWGPNISTNPLIQFQ